MAVSKSVTVYWRGN